jgi:hypothetical protein
MLNQIGPRTVLLWFFKEPLSDAPWNSWPVKLSADLLFITAA